MLLIYSFLSVALFLQSSEAVDLKEDMVIACYKGNAEIVSKLTGNVKNLDFQIEISKLKSRFELLQNGDDWTPLTAAIAGKQWSIASFLIGLGANPDGQTKFGYAPIWLVAEKSESDPNALQFARLLIAKSKNLNSSPKVTTDTFHIETAIDRAIAKLDVEMVEMLIDSGAEIRMDTKSRFAAGFDNISKLKSSSVSKLVGDGQWKKSERIKKLLFKE